jgi:hypothetical protein
MTLTTVNWATGLVRLQGPAGQSQAAGIVLTITNAPPSSAQATAVLSNGLLTVTAGIASNSLNQIASMTATNLALQLNLVAQ